MIARNVQSSSVKYRLAFGSCFDSKRNKSTSGIFDKIYDEKPDSFVWLGDFAYLDDPTYVDGKKVFVPNTIEEAKRRFDRNYNDPHYSKLRKNTKVYGIWDDHDSGINDSDKTNPQKEEIRQLFLDYMEEPQISVRRRRAGGMYESYYLDEGGLIKLILLDVRYDRDSLSDASKSFEEKSILGEEQEEWLRNEVLSSEAIVTLIGIGNQLIPDDRLLIEVVFPKTRRMILTMHNPKTTLLLLSGDVHSGEILEDDCSAFIHGYPLLEFTSSGLTHSIEPLADTWKLSIDRILELMEPETFSRDESRYAGRNYGLVDFSLVPEDPGKSEIKLSLKDGEGQIKLFRSYSLEKDFKKRDTPDFVSYEKCLERRGSPKWRIFLNLIKRGIDPKSELFYLLVLICGILILFLWGLLKLSRAIWTSTPNDLSKIQKAGPNKKDK